MELLAKPLGRILGYGMGDGGLDHFQFGEKAIDPSDGHGRKRRISAHRISKNPRKLILYIVPLAGDDRDLTGELGLAF